MKAQKLNAAFAEIVRAICHRKNISASQFTDRIDQPLDVARKLYYGQHPWMGFTTFRELDRVLQTTPGHMEQVYQNVLEKHPC